MTFNDGIDSLYALALAGGVRGRRLRHGLLMTLPWHIIDRYKSPASSRRWSAWSQAWTSSRGLVLTSGRAARWRGNALADVLRRTVRLVAHTPFDEPTDADLEDPDRMWIDQISGRRNFEPSSFMGFINDLLEREDWRGLFADLPKGAEFVAKLNDFFARHRGGLRGHNHWYPYFHPLQRNALEPDRLTELAQQHVAELARIAELAGAHELRERLSSLTTMWIDEHREHSPMRKNSSDLDIEVYETIGNFLVHNQDAQTTWFDCLKEACYAVAADYNLQRYFMSDYYRIRFDYRAYYELWIGGGKLFFDDGHCLVIPVQRR